MSLINLKTALENAGLASVSGADLVGICQGQPCSMGCELSCLTCINAMFQQ